jgi:UDP-N-acetylglucosamine--N-acetylmuramyl-(pentapeptide) pyrophosphoryl-undecaprenol N-acetylglucosamine transferase
VTQPIRYLLAGGGTAGHVNPLLAVADRIVRRQPTAIIRVLGTVQGLESRLVPERGYELTTVARLPFPRRINSAAIRFPQNFAALVTRIAEIITDEQIDVVVGFGGYVSAPAYLAARRVGVPFVIHEANARAGMANRLGAVFTPYVGVAFNAAKLPHRRFTGMPLRAEIESLDRAAKRAEALTFFGLDHRKPTLLVTGGSQGAQHINETVNAAAALILGAGWQILHITGSRSEIVSTELADYKLIAYCDRMDLALAAADLAVARAGAATVSEFSALGLPAVYVPLAIGNGEQKLNATDAVKAGGAVIVNNADFTPLWVSDQLVPLLLDRALIAEMAARTVTVAVMDGADRLVDLINEALASRETDKQSAN